MKRKTTDALEMIDQLFASNEAYGDAVAEEQVRAQAASEICEARRAAGLTQKQLADMVGTHQSVIARLEAADYEGHTISMLNRIATALGKRLEVRFVA
jgi:ribosome-binding protein aMBF1 (putative translation factor)